MRITLKAYDHQMVDQSAKKIIETVRKSGAQVSGPRRTISCTVTCRQFYKLDIRSTENLRNPAATSRFNAIKVTTSKSIYDILLKCNCG